MWTLCANVRETLHKPESPYGHWEFHYTSDPLTRYVRDRRLYYALECISSTLGTTIGELRDWSVLITCGGVGGEGTCLANLGFSNITVTDISPEYLDTCRRFDPRLETMVQDAEGLTLAPASYDLVLVQDGLHELRQPVSGLIEMLRVSRKAVVVIEPHISRVAKLFGTKWEQHDKTEEAFAPRSTHYVFRWNEDLFTQAVRSYLGTDAAHVKTIRLWDHNVQVSHAVRRLPARHKAPAAKLIYKLLGLVLPRAGNMFIGVVIKRAQPS